MHVVPYALTPNSQLWPRSLNTQIGDTPGCIYLIISDIGIPTGEGLDSLHNGYGLLERFYSLYDTTKQQVGLAATKEVAHDFRRCVVMHSSIQACLI